MTMAEPGAMTMAWSPGRPKSGPGGNLNPDPRDIRPFQLGDRYPGGRSDRAGYRGGPAGRDSGQMHGRITDARRDD